MSRPRTPPFPCGSCREKALFPDEIPYRTEASHDGRLYELEIERLHVLKCRSCGEVALDVTSDEQITAALRERLNLLSPEQISENRRALNLTQRDMAAAMGAAEATISRWETGTVVQSKAMDRMLRVFFEFPEVRDALSQVILDIGQTARQVVTGPLDPEGLQVDGRECTSDRFRESLAEALRGLQPQDLPHEGDDEDSRVGCGHIWRSQLQSLMAIHQQALDAARLDCLERWTQAAGTPPELGEADRDLTQLLRKRFAGRPGPAEMGRGHLLLVYAPRASGAPEEHPARRRIAVKVLQGTQDSASFARALAGVAEALSDIPEPLLGRFVTETSRHFHALRSFAWGRMGREPQYGVADPGASESWPDSEPSE